MGDYWKDLLNMAFSGFCYISLVIENYGFKLQLDSPNNIGWPFLRKLTVWKRSCRRFKIKGCCQSFC